MLVLVFALSCMVARFFLTDELGYSSFWPPNAAMLVALLTLRPRLAAGVLVAGLAINFAINAVAGGLSPPESFLACVLNVVLALVAAPMTRRFCGAATDLTRPRRFAAFTLIALLSAAIEAAIGVAIEYVLMGDGTPPFGEWMQWVLCDALGLLLATPAVMHLVRAPRPEHAAWQVGRGTLVWLLSCVVLTIVSFAWARTPLFLFLYPALAMLAFHARPVWSLTAVFFVSTFASALTAHGWGPIARLSPDGTLMRESMMEPYLFSLLMVVLPINNAVGEKRRDTRRLMVMKANLEYAATHDMLTSTMNRQKFEAILRSVVEWPQAGAVLFIDVDDFKGVNDSMGHQAGDEFLKAFSDRLRDLVLWRGGSVGRFGGDEFAAFVPGRFSPEELDSFCGMMSRALRAPYCFAGIMRSVTASIGAVTIGTGRITADELIHRADTALYATKAAGRDGYTIFTAPAADLVAFSADAARRGAASVQP
ncbi:diguanylate cyclase domain-containing protein [Gluconacetobacter sacchari]|uniref:Sensor domain-containing diguanylate cyclase n=2 Tax=Gluconacetobacter sacchari TaxID=92759 RepID=A0A7W4IBZ5_9PROT|nr:diguanylate cyclase [Gluconacetobacter sacchari]MBB2160071.1 sensor domain-containing diguanylate cyclase [Gluconacetobacter sacchari]